jgi:hypothetical protein
VAAYRAWRFLHPDLEAGPEAAGLQIGPTGSIEMIEDDAAVRQSVLLLITTIPGERVMRPDYGCDLHRLIFSPNDDTTAGLAIHYVRRAIEQWETRVRIVRLDAGRNPDDAGRLEILLEYAVRVTGRRNQLALSVDLSGAP